MGTASVGLTCMSREQSGLCKGEALGDWSFAEPSEVLKKPQQLQSKTAQDGDAKEITSPPDVRNSYG